MFIGIISTEWQVKSMVLAHVTRQRQFGVRKQKVFKEAKYECQLQVKVIIFSLFARGKAT